MREILLAARKHVSLGVVSGSDASKILEQLGKNAADVRSLFDWIFTENGVVSWHKEEQLAGEVNESACLWLPFEQRLFTDDWLQAWRGASTSCSRLLPRLYCKITHSNQAWHIYRVQKG